MNNREQRLLALLDKCGLSTDGLNYAEIRAYCEGMDFVMAPFERWRSRLPRGVMPVPPDRGTIEEAFSSCTYSLNDSEVIFTDYDIDTIGSLCEEWMGMNMQIRLNADGISWGQLSQPRCSWHTINTRRLKWSMIRSLAYEQYIQNN